MRIFLGDSQKLVTIESMRNSYYVYLLRNYVVGISC